MTHERLDVPALRLLVLKPTERFVERPATREHEPSLLDDLSGQTVAGDEEGGPTAKNWISRDLGLIGAMLLSSPRGKTTVKIQNVVRNEPDPSLFVVPPEHTIKEIAFPVPPK
jgi:hypothetical protein